MSDYGEIDDEIDWDAAVLLVDSAEPSTSKLPSVKTIEDVAEPPDLTGSDGELLQLYELLYRADESGVDLHDIEDMGSTFGRQVSKSLFDQFRRRRGFLSVTDLTAPGGWCEVQYSYSLLGRRDLRPEARPERIVTAAGKEIKVDKKIAIAHEKVLEKGREVHRVLEREVHPEQIYVRTKTKADNWGLRILNQIVSLATLQESGKARELPIFGFVEDLFVIGVMDEVERRVLPGQEKQETPEKEDSSKISFYFQLNSPIKAPKTGLFLVDSKTRRVRSRPKDEYTTASRFQLMLYKSFFDLHASDSFDWPRFFEHVKVPAEESFSTSFLEQTRIICAGIGLNGATEATTIGGLVEALRALHLEMGRLQDKLELVYRWRGAASSQSFNRPTTKKARHSSSLEDEDLQKAIAASLNDHYVDQAAVDTSEGSEPPAPIEATPSTGIEVQPLPKTLKRVRVDSTPSGAAATTPTIADITAKAATIRAEEEGSIIAVTKFDYNKENLDAYLQNSVSFWKGRAPIGVGIDEVNKCRSCEFQDGCEWLAAKAEEERLKAVARRADKGKRPT